MNIDLNKIGGGALQARFNREFEKAVKQYLADALADLQYITVLA